MIYQVAICDISLQCQLAWIFSTSTSFSSPGTKTRNFFTTDTEDAGSFGLLPDFSEGEGAATAPLPAAMAGLRFTMLRHIINTAYKQGTKLCHYQICRLDMEQNHTSAAGVKAFLITNLCKVDLPTLSQAAQTSLEKVSLYPTNIPKGGLKQQQARDKDKLFTCTCFQDNVIMLATKHAETPVTKQ